MSKNRRTGSLRSSRSTDEPTLVDLDTHPISTRASQETEVGSISLGELHAANIGIGTYQTGNGEAGAYAFRNQGPLSIGGGLGANRLDVWGFLSVEATQEVGPGIGIVTEGALVMGVDSNGAYIGNIAAQGSSVGNEWIGGAVLTGKESVSYLHPIETLFTTFRSVIGPLADPTTFIDPFQDSAPNVDE